MSKESPERVITELGNRIRSLRKELGLSQEGFADEVGMDRTYISGIERGRLNPSVRNLARIAAELKVPIASLFGCSGECVKYRTKQSKR